MCFLQQDVSELSRLVSKRLLLVLACSVLSQDQARLSALSASGEVHAELKTRHVSASGLTQAQ